MKGKVTKAETDIYVGAGAGKKLLMELEAAKRNVLIISPYISKSTVEILLRLATKGISISLFTTQKFSRLDMFGLRDIVYQTNLIQRTETPLTENVKQRKKLRAWAIVLLIVAVMLLIATFLTFIYKTGLPAAPYSYRLILLLLALGMISLFVATRLFSKEKKIPIRMFDYYSLIDFQVLPSQGSFVHSKIYIIDDEVAYLGSMNFTGYGMNSNIECNCRITNPKAIWDIKEFFLHEISFRERYALFQLGAYYWPGDCYSR